MDTRTLLLIISPLAAIGLILALAMLISIARKALPWGQKWMWLLLLFTLPLGPIIYFAVGSNILEAKAAQYHDTTERRPQ